MKVSERGELITHNLAVCFLHCGIASLSSGMYRSRELKEFFGEFSLEIGNIFEHGDWSLCSPLVNLKGRRLTGVPI